MDLLVVFRHGWLDANGGDVGMAFSAITKALGEARPAVAVTERRDKIVYLHVVPADGLSMDVIPAFASAQPDLPELLPFLVDGVRVLRHHNDYGLLMIDVADASLNGTLKPLIQMVKHWNREAGQPLGYLHLEVMSWAVLNVPPINVADGLRALFAGLANRVLEPCADPVGEGPDLDQGLPEDRAVLGRTLLSVAGQIAQAVAFEEAGQHDEAHRIMRALLGDVYPEAPAPARQVLLEMDVMGAVPSAELPVLAAESSITLAFSKVGGGARQAPGAPIAWPALAEATVRLAEVARTQRSSGGPPVHYVILVHDENLGANYP